MAEVSFIGAAALQAKAVEAVTQAVSEAAHELVGLAQPLTRWDTGAERGGIHVDSVTPSATGATAVVSTGGASAAYDLYQHEGTRYMEGTHFLAIPIMQEGPVLKEHIASAARGVF